jgi:hypothetical protein
VIIPEQKLLPWKQKQRPPTVKATQKEDSPEHSTPSTRTQQKERLAQDSFEWRFISPPFHFSFSWRRSKLSKARNYSETGRSVRPALSARTDAAVPNTQRTTTRTTTTTASSSARLAWTRRTSFASCRRRRRRHHHKATRAGTGIAGMELVWTVLAAPHSDGAEQRLRTVEVPRRLLRQARPLLVEGYPHLA